MKKITITEYKNIMKSMKIEEIYIEYCKDDKIKLKLVGEMKESKSNQAPAWFIEFENNLNNNLDKRFKRIDLKLDLILDCPTIKKEIDHSKLNKLS